MRRGVADAPEALIVSRDEFYTHYWNYQAGEHATFAGPSGWGKTQLMNELLAGTATSRLRATVLCSKFRDPTTSKFLRETEGFHRALQWPPSATERAKARLRGDPMEDTTRGWVVWPKLRGEPEYDGDKLYHEMRRAMLEPMGSKGNRIVVADDLLALSEWVKLSGEIQYVYWNGRSSGVGLWGAIQRPAHAPMEAYSQSHHIFMSNSPEKRDRDRYREIGGISSETIEKNLARCRKFQWFYVHRETGGCLIIDK